MVVFLSCIFVVIFLIMYRFEKKRSVINPLFCFFFPYGLVMLFVSIVDVNKSNSFYKMGYAVPLISIFLLLTFYLVSILVRRIMGDVALPDALLQKRGSTRSKIPFNNYLPRIQLFLLILFAALYFVNFGFKFPDSVTMKSFFSSGIQGHLIIIISTIFLFIYNYKSISRLNIIMKIIGILWFLLSTLMVAKYTMFFYASSIILIYFFRKREKIGLVKILIALIILSLGFFATYIFRFLLSGYTLATVPFDFIFNHYIYYFTSGYYGFSYAMENGLTATQNVGPGLIYSGVINIVRLITGQPYISSISRAIDIPVSASYSDVNVFTFFGSIYLEMGYGHVFLTTIVMAVISTFVFEKNYYYMYRRKDNKLLPLTCFILANLIFGFYNCFLGPIFENVLLLIIMTFLQGISYKKVVVIRRKNNEKRILHV